MDDECPSTCGTRVEVRLKFMGKVVNSWQILSTAVGLMADVVFVRPFM